MRDEPRLEELAAEWAPGTHRVRRSRAGLWVALAIGLVVLAVVGVLAVRWFARPTSPGPGERAVAYFTAVANADASAALDLSATKPQGPLLTDQALAASRQAHPITDIALVEVASHTTTQADVVIGYRRGGQPVRTTIGMVPDGAGNWLARRATATVRIAPTPKMTSPQLDGVRLESDTYTYTVELFPGAHVLTTGAPWLEFREPVLVDAPGTTATVDRKAQPSPAYPARLQAQLKQRLDTCLAARELAPARCPWARKAAPGQPIVRGSVRYRLLSNPWDGFRAPMPGEVEAIARGTLEFRVELTATTTSGQTVTEDFDVKAKYATDLLTEGLDVIWENA